MRKRLARWAARLYPRAWRDRYGPELEALLEDMNARAGDAADLAKGGIAMQWRLRSNLVVVLALLAAGALIGGALSYARPARYRSSATVAVVGRGSDFASAVGAAARNALTRAALTEIIARRGLYPSERERLPFEDVIETMRRNIRFSPATADAKRFRIEFDYGDRYRSQSTVEDLIATWMAALIRSGDGVVAFQLIDRPSLPERLTPDYGRSGAAGAGAGLAAGLIYLAGAMVRRRLRER